MLLKIGRIILKTFIWTIILFILLLLLFDRLVQFRMDDTELADYFHKLSIPAHIGYYKAGGRDIRYIGVGDDSSKPTILLSMEHPALSVIGKVIFQTAPCAAGLPSMRWIDRVTAIPGWPVRCRISRRRLP